MSQEPVRIALKLSFVCSTREPQEHLSRVEAEMLASVARALEDAIANGVSFDRPTEPISAKKLRELVRDMAASAWDAAQLSGESPLVPLHGELSGWGPPLEAAPELPRQVLAVDVLDFLASMMGSGDRVLWEETS